MAEPGEYPDVVPYTLGDLSDVSSAAPATGQPLRWGGAGWAPGAVTERPLYAKASNEYDAIPSASWTYTALEPLTGDENPLLDDYPTPTACELAVATISSFIPDPGVSQCVKINRDGLFGVAVRWTVQRGAVDRAASVGWYMSGYVIVNDEGYGPSYGFHGTMTDRGPHNAITASVESTYSYIEPFFAGDELLFNYYVVRTDLAAFTDTTLGYTAISLTYLGPIV